MHQWYATPSQLRWRDALGQVHALVQGDGGEQGDALMPALFCLALRPAVCEIQEKLPAGAVVVAYLDDIYIYIYVCDLQTGANTWSLRLSA